LFSMMTPSYPRRVRFTGPSKTPIPARWTGCQGDPVGSL